MTELVKVKFLVSTPDGFNAGDTGKFLPAEAERLIKTGAAIATDEVLSEAANATVEAAGFVGTPPEDLDAMRNDADSPEDGEA